MSHTVGMTTTDYIWDVAAGLPVVLQDGTNTYVYGLDLISATDDQNAQTYFTYDGLGSTADLTDDNGDEVDDYTYDVFGAIRSPTGSSPNEFTFTGEQVDGMDLQFLRARYYDPETGRFLSRDPVPFVNRYTYAGNNPVNYVDPSGLCHLETGLWDQVCGYLSHNKEGANFSSIGYPDCSTEAAQAAIAAGAHPQQIYEQIKGVNPFEGTYDQDDDCILQAILDYPFFLDCFAAATGAGITVVVLETADDLPIGDQLADFLEGLALYGAKEVCEPLIPDVNPF